MTSSEKRVPLYSQIRDYVLANIRQRRWRPNDRLPTEKELAEKFGVSKFTVKKALGELVGEGIVYRIQGRGSFVADGQTVDRAATVQESGPASRSLRTVVLLTPNLRSGLSAGILAGAEELLSAQGYELIVKSTGNEQELESRLLKESAEAGVSGVLVFPVDGESYNEEILRLALNKFPVVVIDRYLRGVETNCICSDNEGGAYEAVSHLLGLGHRHIAFAVAHTRTTTSLEERLAGYEKALARQRSAAGPKWIRFADGGDFAGAAEDAGHSGSTAADADGAGRSEGVSELAENAGHLGRMLAPAGTPDDPLADMTGGVREFLAQHPDVTAVFAATPLTGLAVLQAAAELGLPVPERLSVAIFDDIEHSSFFRTPPTCVLQQEKALGTEAAKLLLAVIGNPAQERKKLTLPTRLIVRESTAPPAGIRDGSGLGSG